MIPTLVLFAVLYAFVVLLGVLAWGERPRVARKVPWWRRGGCWWCRDRRRRGELCPNCRASLDGFSRWLEGGGRERIGP